MYCTTLSKMRIFLHVYCRSLSLTESPKLKLEFIFHQCLLVANGHDSVIWGQWLHVPWSPLVRFIMVLLRINCRENHSEYWWSIFILDSKVMEYFCCIPLFYRTHVKKTTARISRIYPISFITCWSFLENNNFVLIGGTIFSKPLSDDNIDTNWAPLLEYNFLYSRESVFIHNLLSMGIKTLHVNSILHPGT